MRLTDKRICDEITSIYITDGGRPPNIEELAQSMALTHSRVELAVERAYKRGKLRKSGKSHWLVVNK